VRVGRDVVHLAADDGASPAAQAAEQVDLAVHVTRLQGVGGGESEAWKLSKTASHLTALKL